MSGEPQLYRINPESRESERIEEVEFSRLGLQERRDIQEWVAANPGILGDDLLVIGKEFSGFDQTNERLDLLAVDLDGKLAVIELKRDDSGADAHWQAIKYASYFRRATADDIVRLAAEYLGVTQDDAAIRLMQHLGADDLNGLNNGQRIILASHRFAPEVVTAAVWLNEQGHSEDMVTCVRLTPHRDAQDNSLYVQASTIVPVPGIDDYLVGIGPSMPSERAKSGGAGTKIAATFSRNKNDEVSQFVKRVSGLAINGLPNVIRPDKVGRWAGDGGGRRYYHLWYSRAPWGNWKVNYSVDLYPMDEAGTWGVVVLFENRQKLPLPSLDGTSLNAEQETAAHGIYHFVAVGQDTLNDDFANKIAEILRGFIEQITPIVDDFGNDGGDGDGDDA